MSRTITKKRRKVKDCGLEANLTSPAKTSGVTKMVTPWAKGHVIGGKRGHANNLPALLSKKHSPENWDHGRKGSEKRDLKVGGNYHDPFKKRLDYIDKTWRLEGVTKRGEHAIQHLWGRSQTKGDAWVGVLGRAYLRRAEGTKQRPHPHSGLPY